MAHRSRCAEYKGLQGRRCNKSSSFSSSQQRQLAQQNSMRQNFMQALFAGPILSVHPWRSPNCKTRAGCDSQAVR